MLVSLLPGTTIYSILVSLLPGTTIYSMLVSLLPGTTIYPGELYGVENKRCKDAETAVFLLFSKKGMPVQVILMFCVAVLCC
jgi:hypothetical protein